MKTLGIVPARAGSKRVPGKNLREVGGRTLVARAIETALGSKRLATVLVSSNDERVLETAAQYTNVIPLERPASLASDTSPAIDYVQHALSTIDPSGEDFDSIAILQPTSPFTLPEDIDRTLDLLTEPDTDSAVSITELPHMVNPLKLKTLVGSRLVPYLEPEAGRMSPHQLPRVFVRNGSVYASWRHIIEAGSLLGNRCRGFMMPSRRSLDINVEEDLLFAEFLLSQGDS